MATKIATFLVSLFVASIIVFGLVNLLPGDVAATILGPNATPEGIVAVRTRLGLDRPIVVRYFEWIGQLASGTFAVSAFTGQSVADTVLERSRATASIVLVGMVLAIVISVPIGMFAAMRRHKADGAVVSAVSQFGMAIPVFVLGLLLSIIVGAKLGWLPANGYVPITRSVTGWLRHIILPSLTVALVQSAILVRYIRSAFIDVLRQDYYRTARAMGWRRWPALFRHGLRNAAMQLVTVIGLQIGSLIVGAIVVESVFTIPGLGQYLLMAVNDRDLPVVSSVVMLVVAVVLIINFLVDLLYVVIDPRIRTQEATGGTS